MSELTPCNYCNLRWIQHDAKKMGQTVTVVASKSFPGWKEVRVDGETMTTMMEISSGCCC